MSLNGGTVLPSSATYAIFWGTSWGVDTAFTRDKISGLQSFFSGFANSAYQRVLLEYYDNLGSVTGYDGQFYTSDNITTISSFVQAFIDNSGAPESDPTTATVNNEVCSVLSQHGASPNPDALYSVYATTPFDGSFCGWHAAGSCGGTPVQFAFYPARTENTAPNGGTCNVGDNSGLHSAGLAALANTSAHELAETITDPDAASWYAGTAPQDGEVGDKCNFTFDPNAPLVTLANGAQFKLQTLWSNKAFNRHYGVQNGNDEFGCLNGQDHTVVSIISGPNPPSWTGQYYACTWTASAVGGTPPYTFIWSGGEYPRTQNGASYTTGTPVSGIRFYQISVIAQDATGQADTTQWSVGADGWQDRTFGTQYNRYPQYCTYWGP